jgi:hypothetical protein
VGSKGSATVTGHKPAGAFRFEGVQPGDLLELMQGGPVYRIRRVLSPNSLELGREQAPSELERDIPQPAVPNATPNYRIVRQPQREPGTRPFRLPENWVIDLSPRPPHGHGLTTDGVREILFAPTGQVMQPQSDAKVTWLWLREPAAVPVPREALVEVWTRTGLVLSHPVNRDPKLGGGDPYYYARRGGSGDEP